ncbi:hypothetical protein P4H94_26775 [Paenibacillus macerans]|uniref:hypothetical protein n=1 Tax=Paenibacillus macerans TaxID=44252 RepID=UPI0029074FD3|nr:hypothetical protein [Paenibacillus macerans]MDU5945475.1 hypothetical protein [Paenibacillus macerans]MEC0140451.1 hypothetical protein [Paenibacillus macerans]
MPQIPGMEMRFTVIKNEDVEKYLDARDKSELSRILWKIEQGRYEEGKEAVNKYLVVNVDESYAPEIIEIMKANKHWGSTEDPNQFTAQIVDDQLVLPGNEDA